MFLNAIVPPFLWTTLMTIENLSPLPGIEYWNLNYWWIKTCGEFLFSQLFHFGSIYKFTFWNISHFVVNCTSLAICEIPSMLSLTICRTLVYMSIHICVDGIRGSIFSRTFDLNDWWFTGNVMEGTTTLLSLSWNGEDQYHNTLGC